MDEGGLEGEGDDGSLLVGILDDFCCKENIGRGAYSCTLIVGGKEWMFYLSCKQWMIKEDGCVFFCVWKLQQLLKYGKKELSLFTTKEFSMEEVWNMEHPINNGPKKNSVALETCMWSD